MQMLYKRTHMCGELRLADEGKKVVLNGWVAKARSLGGLVFVDLRDKTGITQITFNEDVPAEVLEKAKSLRSEYCIGIKGTVKERSSKNPNLPTGDIEVFADDIEIYSESDTPPIYVKDDDNVSDELRLKYRYLDLRKSKMQRNLSVRHRVVKCARDYFRRTGFHRGRDTDAHKAYSGRSPRLHSAEQGAQRKLLRSAAVSSDVQAASDGGGHRQIHPDREVLQG